MKQKLEDYNFDLPDNLIAQNPCEKRDQSRLLVLNKKTENITHAKFHQIKEYLKDGDLLVFNNAKVIHARVFCERSSGGKFEMILTGHLSGNRWLVLTNRTKKLKKDEIFFAQKDRKITFRVVTRVDDYLEVEASASLSDTVLKKIGELPLPSYIKREADDFDENRYQTVYASESGAVAAPTAGLHITDELLNEIRSIGVDITFLTLYVSWGTFQPVREDDLSEHKMHSEKYFLSTESADIINEKRAKGKRIIAVGTTSLRVLESTYLDGENKSGYGETDIFIYPPYKVKSIDAIITNFHTPYSTLLMLVSAFSGYDTIMATYQEAIDQKYRFFSYGDAMFIE